MKTLSERLKSALSIRGYRPIDLCRETGISKSIISAYLGGTRSPKQDKIYIMAKALNVDEAWLMGYDTEMTRRPRGVAPAGEDTPGVNAPGEYTVLASYRALNAAGKERLLERAQELLSLPGYQDWDSEGQPRAISA